MGTWNRLKLKNRILKKVFVAFNTPILLITWKRPKETLRVINALSIVKPSNIYISSDGARLNYPEEFKKVNDTRKIVENYRSNKP